MLLQLEKAKFAFADHTIFEQTTLQLNQNDRIGIVGSNGIGKSTLLNCIAGQLALTEGQISYAKDLSIGYLKQNSDFDSNLTLFDELMKVFAVEIGLLKDISDISTQLSTLDHMSQQYHQLSKRYDSMLKTADSLDAYNCEVKVRTVLHGMGMEGFSNSIVSTLSGGERTKSALCKLLLTLPDLLILDEPTNHLDYKTLDWLEDFLKKSKSAMLVVSHDRFFLDRLCNKIWDFYQKNIVSYNGSYTQFKVQKAEMMEVQQREHDRAVKVAEKLTDYIARNKVRASTAKMAKSREKQLEKLEIVDTPEKPKPPPRFKFELSTESAKAVLSVKNLDLSFGNRQILQNVCFDIEKGEKVALLGLNGTGKSSLIKLIAKNDRLGNIIIGKNVRLGYYDQETSSLNNDLNLLDQLWFENSRFSQTQVRSMLSLAGFTGEDAFKKVKNLSGGERAKLQLIMLMAKDNNFLLLDEPTNHLDLPSREALELALKNFTGTILFVSHDRYFVNSIASTVAEIENKQISLFKGNYDSYIKQKSLENAEQSQKNNVANFSSKSGGSLNSTEKSTSSNQTEQQKPTGKRSAKQRAIDTNKKLKIKSLEQTMTDIEQAETTLLAEISTPEVTADFRLLQEKCHQLEDLKKQYDQAFAQWEALHEE